jgi:hypothetical protein
VWGGGISVLSLYIMGGGREGETCLDKGACLIYFSEHSFVFVGYQHQWTAQKQYTN